MYAYFTAQVYNISFSGDKVSFSSNPLKVSYISSSQITLTPASGYYFESISCSTGYTVSGFASGTSHYSTQTITITNNSHVGGGTCTVKMHTRNYPATPIYHVHKTGNGISSSSTIYSLTNPGGCYVASGHTHNKTGTCSQTYVPGSAGHYACLHCGWTWAVGDSVTACPTHGAGTTIYVPGSEGYYRWSCGSPTNTWNIGCGKTEGVTIDSYSCPNGGSLSGTTCVFS